MINKTIDKHLKTLDRISTLWFKRLFVQFQCSNPKAYGMPDSEAIVFHSFGRLQFEYMRIKNNPGDGKRVLQSVCKYCDKYGLKLILGCVPALQSYYISMGFELTPGGKESCLIMTRNPSTSMVQP